MLKKIFEDKIIAKKTYIEQHKKKYNSLSNLRLIIGMLCLITTYILIEIKAQWFYFIGAIIIYSMFVKLLQEHKKIKNQLELAKGLIRINENYLKRLNNEWISFEDKGEAFEDASHPYAIDLDIVGEKSLFQLICVAHTWYGRKSLAKALLEPCLEEETILLRQQSIKELGSKLDWIQKVEYESAKDSTYSEEPKMLIRYSKSEDKVFPLSKVFINILTGITVISLGLAIVLGQEKLYIVTGIGAIIQFTLTALYSRRIGYALGMVRQIHYKLEAYDAILQEVKKETFHTQKLKEIKAVLFEENNSALVGMRMLTGVADKATLTGQPLLSIPLNAILLWDIRSVIQLEKWKANYGNAIEKWLEAIGELESLMSLSVLNYLNEEITYPLLQKGERGVVAKQIGHPLISSEKRIANDVEMKDDIWIITGSNMSGKTTFLRTIGINLILAYSGAPVIAKEMQVDFFNIYTSMRIRDDLKEGVSTFYAELMRIKMITEAAQEKASMLFLVDEIFRGTNSIDRITGAKSVLKGLNQEGIVGAITTHDLELCALDEYKRIMNFHFTEYYNEDNIMFDYKLKKGPSTSTNAKYLMKMVGIELIED